MPVSRDEFSRYVRELGISRAYREPAKALKGTEGYKKCVIKANDKVTIDKKCYEDVAAAKKIPEAYAAQWE